MSVRQTVPSLFRSSCCNFGSVNFIIEVTRPEARFLNVLAKFFRASEDISTDKHEKRVVRSFPFHRVLVETKVTFVRTFHSMFLINFDYGVSKDDFPGLSRNWP